MKQHSVSNLLHFFTDSLTRFFSVLESGELTNKTATSAGTREQIYFMNSKNQTKFIVIWTVKVLKSKRIFHNISRHMCLKHFHWIRHTYTQKHKLKLEIWNNIMTVSEPSDKAKHLSRHFSVFYFKNRKTQQKQKQTFMLIGNGKPNA